MKHSPTVAPRIANAEAARLYEIISRDPRYAHHVRIPGRICRCLDYFRVAYPREAVSERLCAYYLFVGVIDEALDSKDIAAGAGVLAQFRDPRVRFDEQTLRSPEKLVTEVLKRCAGAELHAVMSAGLEDLYAAVVGEHEARTFDEFVRARRAVGRLTAELSWLLVRPLVVARAEQHEALRSFFAEVGEVGCLVDSVIDLRADGRERASGFRPSAAEHVKLLGLTLGEAARMFAQRPALVGLFLEGVADVLRDRFRAATTNHRPDSKIHQRAKRMLSTIRPKAGW